MRLGTIKRYSFRTTKFNVTRGNAVSHAKRSRCLAAKSMPISYGGQADQRSRRELEKS